jgi:hypothetical protein
MAGISTDKRERIENLVYDVMKTLDPSGDNKDKYKNKFEEMKTNKEFDEWLSNFLEDDSENFYLETEPFEKEPDMEGVKKAADILDIELEEYIYYPDEDGNEIRSRTKVPVGLIT